MGKKSDTCPRFIWVNKRVVAVSEAVFAPGYHFCPNDNDLLTYLRNKNMEQDLDLVDRVIKVIDVYKYPPGELLKMHLPVGEQELYFFCPVTMKYLSGLRVNRSSEAGNWRITGQDRKLYGMLMRTLVFYDSEHKRTNWIMHEYRLEDKELSEKRQKSEVNYVLCKLYEKSEPNVKDSQQAGAFVKQRESKDSAYIDRIVIIPESLITNLFGMECLLMNASVLHGSLQSSADDGNNTPNLLQNADKDNYVLGKPYEKREAVVEDNQNNGAFISEIEMKDNPEPLISKLFGSEYLPINTSIQGESLQNSADNDNKTLDVLGNTDKLGSFKAQILPNKVQTSADMALDDVETRVDHDPPNLQEMAAELGMHIAWESSIDFNTFDNLGWGRMMSDMYVDEFGWFSLPNVRDDSDIHMEDLSGWDTNGRISSDMSIDEYGWLGLPRIWDGPDTYVEDLSG